MTLVKKCIIAYILVCVCLCQCVHDDFIKNTTVHYYNDLTEKRLLQTSTVGPLRIWMDYSQVTVGGTLEKNYIKRMMNITANYFYNLLTVQRLSQLYFPANTSLQCKSMFYLGNILTIPSVYVTQGTSADVGVVVGS